MIKKTRFYWTKNHIRIILCVLLSLVEVCTSDESSRRDVELEEARVARDTAERRNVQLEIELEQAKKSLEKMRSRYADLYLRSHGLVGSLRQTELQVANLWHSNDDSSLNVLAERLLEALDAVGTRQLEVADALKEYEESLTTLLNVLQPSEAMRGELTERLNTLKQAVEKGMRPLMMASGMKSSAASVRTGCRVLAADEELDMVLLDGGRVSGMSPESRWMLLNGEKVVAKFIVVDVRLELSAAVLLEGVLTDVPVGSVLLPLREYR